MSYPSSRLEVHCTVLSLHANLRAPSSKCAFTTLAKEIRSRKKLSDFRILWSAFPFHCIESLIIWLKVAGVIFEKYIYIYIIYISLFCSYGASNFLMSSWPYWMWMEVQGIKMEKMALCEHHDFEIGDQWGKVTNEACEVRTCISLLAFRNTAGAAYLQNNGARLVSNSHCLRK